MLKQTEGEPPPEERSIGELVQGVVEEAKAYALAEIDFAKAVATAKLRALAWPAGLFFLALLVAQAAVTVLAVGIFAAPYWAFGPILAAIIASFIFVMLAGGLAWYAFIRLRREL